MIKVAVWLNSHVYARVKYGDTDEFVCDAQHEYGIEKRDNALYMHEGLLSSE